MKKIILKYPPFTALLISYSSLFTFHFSVAAEPERPNILWLVCEDISPHLGCYGDTQAHTPNLDQLAADGVRFSRAYANSPVCAVARSALLTGMHSSTLGTQHMRSRPMVPDTIPLYPRLFKKAGYYCYNGQKTDYNSKNLEEDKEKFWDVTGGHQSIAKLPKDKPFMAVFNTSVTHEGQLREDREKKYVVEGKIPTNPRIPTAEIMLPPYHPDLPGIRHDWARFYDQITMMDSIVGEWLDDLEKEGLADNTIIFFFSDHGGMLSRSKRFIFNNGTQVPLIIRVPEKWRHLAEFDYSKYLPGSVNDELVQFVDFPKTILSMVGISPSPKMHGRVFMGPKYEAEPPFVYFYRDRQNGRYDMSRAVTDGRYYLIRNFMPHRPRGQKPEHGYTVQRNWNAWADWFERKKEEAPPVYARFFKPKPVLEFYDLHNDPWQIHNLCLDSAKVSSHQGKISFMQNALFSWMIEIRDTSLIPEAMFYDLIGDGTPFPTVFDYGKSKSFQIVKALEAAKLASQGEASLLKRYLEMLGDVDPIVRHWAAYGIYLVGRNDMDLQKTLREFIQQETYSANRVMAAQALSICGDPRTAYEVLSEEIFSQVDESKRLLALNALEYANVDQYLDDKDWKKLDSHAHAKNKGDPLAYLWSKSITEFLRERRSSK